MSDRIRLALAAAALAGAAVLLAPDVRAADAPRDGGVPPGPDMRILTTPEEVLFRVDLGRPARRLQSQAIAGAQGWCVPLAPKAGPADAAWPTPATDGERIFVGGPLASTDFYAFAAETGRLAWKASLNDNGPTPAVVRDRRVYFNTQSCTLYAYDARSGTRVWSRYLANHLESIPALADEAVVTTRPQRHEKRGGAPALTSLDLRGRIVADVTIDGEALGAPVVHDGKAYLATRAGTLFCVDVAAGREDWRRACQARSAPWVDDSGVYVAAHGALQAYNPRTGRARWSDVAVTPSSREEQLPGVLTPPNVRPGLADAATTDAFWGEGLRPVAVTGRLCIAEGRALRLFDRVTGVETAWWELDVADAFVGAPLVAGDTVVVATRGGQVRGVDARRGEIVWGVDLGAPLGSGVIVQGGRLYAVTRDGRLACVHTGDLRADGWPMWGGTPSHAGPATSRDPE